MKILFALTISLLVVGCKKDTVTPDPEHGRVCDTTNPVEDLPWLKSAIADVSGPSTYADFYAMRATYKGRTVIWINICCPACNTIPPQAKYCDGSFAGQLVTDIQNDELTGITEIWRTHNGICVGN